MVTIIFTHHCMEDKRSSHRCRGWCLHSSLDQSGARIWLNSNNYHEHLIKSINISKLRTWYTFSRTRGPSRRLSPPSHPLWRRRQWSNASPSPASDNWGQTICNNDETINYIWLTSSLTRLSSVLRASSSCSPPRWARAPPGSSPGASSWCPQWSDQAVSSRAAGQHQNPFYQAAVQDLY